MAEERPTVQPDTIRRIVYREISNADRLKFTARSNRAATGGGARDIRFRPYTKFGDVFSRLFPETRTERTKANPSETIFVGKFNWLESGALREMESKFVPPNDSRDTEGRLTQVNKYPCFTNLPDGNEGMVLLLLIQDANGSVWPVFATEKSLGDPGWNRDVADKILNCINAKRSRTAVAGYMDFETGQEFCNGK